MREHLIEKVKQKLDELKKLNEEQKELINRLEEANNTANAALNELIELEKEKVHDDNELTMEAFYTTINFSNIKELDKDIYVYMGAYITGLDGNKFTTDKSKAYYYLYYNIEYKKDIEIILQEEKEKFEKEHTIIEFADANSYEEIYDKYKIAQQIYFNELVNDTKKEEIVKKIKSYK